MQDVVIAQVSIDQGLGLPFPFLNIGGFDFKEILELFELVEILSCEPMVVVVGVRFAQTKQEERTQVMVPASLASFRPARKSSQARRYSLRPRRARPRAISRSKYTAG